MMQETKSSVIIVGFNYSYIYMHNDQVTYNVDGFLEKNRDTLSENFRRCMRLSDARLVFELFSPVSDLGQLNLK